MAKTRGATQKAVKILKTDPEKHLVYGVVLEPETVDLQGEIYSAEEVEKACHRWMIEYQQINEQHQGPADARPVQCYISEPGLVLGVEQIKAGSWILVTKILNVDLWDAVLSGGLNSYSIGGWADSEPDGQNNRLSDILVEEISLVKMGANNKKFCLFKSFSFKSVGKGAQIMPETPDEPGQGSGSPGPVVGQGVSKAEMEDAIQKALEGEKAEKEALRKELEQTKAENRANKEALEKSENIRLDKEYLETAKGIPSLGKPEETGPMLKELSLKAPDAYGKLLPILMSMDRQISEGKIFEEVGKTGGGPAPGSAEEKLSSIAKLYVEKGISKGPAEAFTKACQDNEELYEEYVAERRRK